MALAIKDRVKELTTTTGTGTLTLTSAPSGYRRFSSVLSDGDTTYYCIESGSSWEVGVGTYSANTLARTTVLASSNANSLVNITAARSFVFITYPASKAVYRDGSGKTVIEAAGLIFSDASVQTTAATSPDLSPYLTISSAASTYLTQSSATTLLAAKADLVGGLIPSAQLPSYVDDVVEAANLAAFPGTGETGKIYVAIDTGYTYRWSGSVYVRINEVDLSSYLTTSTAASTYLPLAGGTLTGDLKFTDGTYDIGKSGATRPRDGFFSRNVTVATLTTGYGAGLVLGDSYSSFSVGAGEITVRAINVPVALFSSGQFRLKSDAAIAWSSGAVSAAGDLFVYRDAANTLHQRNSTNAQTFRLAETWTSSTSFGALQIKANAGSAYQIGSAVGSAGGTNRAIDFGHYDSAGSFTGALRVATTGYVGVATTSPREVLDVTGNIVTDWTNRFIGTQFQTGTIYRLGLTTDITLRTTSVVSYTGPTEGTSVVDFRVGNPSSPTIALKIVDNGSIIATPRAVTSGSPTAFTLTGAAHTTLSTAEVTDGYFNAARTVNFGATGGTIASQRTWRFTAPTFTAAAATTLTTMSTVSISGPPVASTLVTGTNAWSLNVESGPSNFAGKITAPATGQASTGGIGNGNNGVDFFNGVMIYLNNGGSPIYPVWCTTNASIPRFKLASNCLLAWGNSTDASSSVAYDLALQRGSANVLDLQNGTNPQTFRVAGTWTSTTSYELINIKGKASANFEIGPENGSAGGTLRGLTIGGYPAGTATIVGWAQFRPNASTGSLEAFYLGPIADSTATGGNARGQHAVDLQMVRSAANQVASGTGAIAIGRYSRASGSGSIAIGESNTSSGLYTVAIGYGASASGFGAVATGAATCSAGYGIAIGGRDNVSNGNYSVAIGNFVTSSGVYSVAFQQCVASGDYSWAYGLQANADRPLMAAYAQGSFSANGDAQQVKWVLRNKTTGNTATTLFVGGSSTRLTIPSGKTMSCKVTVKGIKSDGSAKARFVRLVEITNVSGSTTLDTAVEAIGTDYNPSGCDCDITADNVNDALQINVTGVAAETWRWVAIVEGLEIAYGT